MFELEDVKYKDILHIKQTRILDEKVTTLFGESGSGKSTLMKLLNRLISPDSGTIYYKEKNIEQIEPILLRREVIMLGQSPVIEEGTIKDNLLLGLKFSEKRPVPDSKLTEVIKKLDLHKKLSDSASNLSGGEKQRIAFGRVILMDPKVYLLDEPTSALDEETENEVMDFFMNHVRETKKTVVMVTHSKKVAERYSDILLSMKEINDERSIING